MRNIGDLSKFIRFLKLCAGRIGQLLNVSSLANECGVSVTTATSWISILEASYIRYLLKPDYNNYAKRLVKAPKLYFYDTGLAQLLISFVEVYLRTLLLMNLSKKRITKEKSPIFHFGEIVQAMRLTYYAQ